MAKIGLWSDCVNFPSLPLMKLSAHHKSLGDTVEFITEGGHYDKAYCSKTFNLPTVKKIPTAPPIFTADETSYGGTGYAINIDNGKEVFDGNKNENLPAEIEHIMPDYSLYPQYKYAVGFTTRGCPNACGFCVVCPKEGRCSVKVADVAEFWSGQKEILKQLIKTKAHTVYNQGLDARFVTDGISKLVLQTNPKMIHFAFDLMKNEVQICKGLVEFRKHWQKDSRSIRVYVLTNYNTTHEEDWYRVRRCIELGYHPYIMIYQKGTHDRFLTDLARWCNNPILFRTTGFTDYVPRKDGKRCGELYSNFLTSDNP